MPCTHHASTRIRTLSRDRNGVGQRVRCVVTAAADVGHDIGYPLGLLLAHRDVIRNRRRSLRPHHEEEIRETVARQPEEGAWTVSVLLLECQAIPYPHAARCQPLLWELGWKGRKASASGYVCLRPWTLRDLNCPVSESKPVAKMITSSSTSPSAVTIPTSNHKPNGRVRYRRREKEGGVCRLEGATPFGEIRSMPAVTRSTLGRLNEGQ